MSIPLSFTEIMLISVAAVLLFLCVFLIITQIRGGIFRGIMVKNQAELNGRLSQMSEYAALEQGRITQALSEQKLELLKIIDEKLLQITQNVGAGINKSAEKTDETLNALRERLVKIDVAQQKISSLSEQVISLREILSNKQARGAFGEIQLHDLVTSILPPSAYDFQFVLSNQKRADCVLKLPNPPGKIVIDSKFPLESYQALQIAANDREKIEAERFFRASVSKHIKDIAEKYIIAGETAESALMFLPSESVYAEIYAHFPDVVESSYRARVWIVSPTTLMATLNTIRAVLKDVSIRQQAGVIQKEVTNLTEDIDRLNERVENLAKHFDQAGGDIAEIKISASKISRRIEKIEAAEFGEDERLFFAEQKKAG